MNESRRNGRHERLMVGSQNSNRSSSSGFIRLSHLRKLRDCEQVAAVCYRRRSGHIEFLLVRTRGNGRWTFPKGSAERGLTQAQAAALEAFEEAGVHGRIEEASFARYFLPKSVGESRGRFLEKDIEVNTYLCEVSRLTPPQESRRNRTWFSPEDARQSLREGRDKSDGAQLARVIDRAVMRITKLGCADREIAIPRRDNFSVPAVGRRDALSEVKFDFAVAVRGVNRASTSYGRYPLNSVPPNARLLDPGGREPSQCEVLEFGSSQRKTPKALGSGNP